MSIGDSCIFRILEYIKSQPAKRKALLVIDGMNYWQWDLITNALPGNDLVITQGTSMAFIPTITAWSRQAIFKGAKPDLNPNNSKEAALFEDYWKRNGYSNYEIGFAKLGVNKNLDIETISESITMLGLVCTDLDDIMHGSILGDHQLKASAIEWIKQSHIVQQILTLHTLGFDIYITSDHGNIEAVGVKNIRVKEKVGALSRSKRHLYYENGTVLSTFQESNPNLEYGIKNTSVFLKDKTAFTEENSIVTTHGGSHLWEVLVPFITIK